MDPTIARQLVELHLQELWAEAAAERFARAARQADCPPVATRRSPLAALRILVAARVRHAAREAHPAGSVGR